MPEAWVGKTFSQALQILREEHGAILIASEHRSSNGKGWLQRVNPSDEEPLAAGDRVIYLAERPIGLT
jgi:hypothetical protein